MANAVARYLLCDAATAAAPVARAGRGRPAERTLAPRHAVAGTAAASRAAAVAQVGLGRAIAGVGRRDSVAACTSQAVRQGKWARRSRLHGHSRHPVRRHPAQERETAGLAHGRQGNLASEVERRKGRPAEAGADGRPAAPTQNGDACRRSLSAATPQVRDLRLRQTRQTRYTTCSPQPHGMAWPILRSTLLVLMASASRIRIPLVRYGCAVPVGRDCPPKMASRRGKGLLASQEDVRL